MIQYLCYPNGRPCLASITSIFQVMGCHHWTIMGLFIYCSSVCLNLYSANCLSPWLLSVQSCHLLLLSERPMFPNVYTQKAAEPRCGILVLWGRREKIAFNILERVTQIILKEISFKKKIKTEDEDKKKGHSQKIKQILDKQFLFLICTHTNRSWTDNVDCLLLNQWWAVCMVCPYNKKQLLWSKLGF